MTFKHRGNRRLSLTTIEALADHFVAAHEHNWYFDNGYRVHRRDGAYLITGHERTFAARFVVGNPASRRIAARRVILFLIGEADLDEVAA